MDQLLNNLCKTLKYLSCIVLLLLAEVGSAQWPDSLSQQAQISVLTIGPSQKNVYAAFGHSALRIIDYPQNAQDSVRNLDALFNYGVFDFNPPAFYFTFLKGELWYKLEIFNTYGFLQHSMEENRSVLEQKLQLNYTEKQKIYSYLRENYKPENQYYFYNYFYNNCATKIRDVLEKNLSDSLELHSPLPYPSWSFRESMNSYMQDFPWFKLGVNLCLGADVDVPMTSQSIMYLPDYVAHAIDHTEIKIPPTYPHVRPLEQAQEGARQIQSAHQASYDSLSYPLCHEKKWLFQTNLQKKTNTLQSLLTPTTIGWSLLLLILLLSYRQYKKYKRNFIPDAILLFLYGSLGLVLLLLWTHTKHMCARNYNLLWASPLHLLAGLSWYIPTLRIWTIRYFMLLAVILLAIILPLIFGLSVFPQKFIPALLPYLLILLTRVLYHIYSHFRVPEK